MRDILDENGIFYINFWFHPFHLFDDLIFLINTNSPSIFNSLKQFEVSSDEFKFATLYWQTQLGKRLNLNFPEIPEGAVLFIGQSLKDSSVKLREKYLTILDYKDKIDDLIREYGTVIYSEHPSKQHCPEIESYLKQNRNIIKTTRPTYSLLASPKIHKVVSLSSSVLFEAQYFGKEIEYLFRPQFNIGGTLENGNAFISVKDSYFTTTFWYEILKDFFNVKPSKVVGLDYYCKPNRLRNIINNWHGFANLDLYKRLEVDLKAALRESLSIGEDKASKAKSVKKINYPVVSNKIYNCGDIRTYQTFDVKGFSHTENWGRWTVGTVAEIRFELVPTDFSGSLDLTFKAHTPRNHSIEVDVYVNGNFSSHLKLSGKRTHKLSLSLNANKPLNSVKFEIKNARSPKSLGVGEDERQLGIGITTLNLRTKRGVVDIFRLLSSHSKFSSKGNEKETSQVSGRSKEVDRGLFWDDKSKRYITSEVSSNLACGINSIGFFKENIGLSHHVRYITRSLGVAEIPFCCKHFELNKGEYVNHEFDNSMVSMLKYNVNLFSLNAPYCLKYHEMFPCDFIGRYNIGYGAWEFDKFPLLWLKQNNILDELWAISDFLLGVFSRYHTIPVVKIPLPIDFYIEPLRKYKRSYFSLPEKKFIFLFSYDLGSDLEGRKNPLAVIDAFKKAFARRDDVLLLIKLADRGAKIDTSTTQQLESLIATIGENTNIRTLNQILTDEEMKALMYVCDAYVSLHRCEGFGLGMAEAMKMGKPVVATNYSGNLEFMKSYNSCLVDFSLIPASSFSGVVNGHMWADPDIDHAAHLMRKLVEDPAYYERISYQAKMYIDKYHSNGAISNLVMERLKLLGLWK